MTSVTNTYKKTPLLNRRKKASAICLFACLFAISCLQKTFGQYYITGQDNGRTHWKEIETEYFRFIFPDFLEPKVQSMTAYCDSFAACNREEYGINLKKKHGKTPVIFHSGGSYSNGLGVWAPRRIEVWTSPPQKSYSQNWFRQLALHEYRHELQMQILDQKGLGVLTSIFGEHIAGLAAGVFVPEWYLEGDAVLAETALSESGRGRNSSFLTPAQVILSEPETFNFSKHNFGSYKDYALGAYLLGYLLLAHDRTEIDSNASWRTNFGNISGNFWKLIPFYLDVSLKDKYESAMNFWKKQWQTYLADSSFFTEYRITGKPEHLTDYHIVGASDSSMTVLKQGNRQEAAFFATDILQNETELCRPGTVYENFAVQHGERIAWCETTLQPRWNLYHNNLVVYDGNTKKMTTLTEKRNIFSPAFAQNGQIVCLENRCDTACYLIFFDSSLNEMRKKIRLPENFEYQYPAPTPSADSIFIFALGNSGKSIWLLTKPDADSCLFEEILPPVSYTMSDLKFVGGDLYYLSDASGVSRVVSLKDGIETPVSGNRFGIVDFTVDSRHRHLIYSEFRKEGFAIFGDTIKARALPYRENPSCSVADAISPEHLSSAISTLSAEKRVSKDYSHLQHLFNFHGWLPAYFNSSDMDLGLGLSAVSQNELGYSILTTNFKWDYNEQSPSVSGEYQYLRFYPKFSLSANYARHHLMSHGESHLFNQFSSGILMSVPYYIAHHNHHFSFNFNASYTFSKLYMLDRNLFENPLLHGMKSSFTFSHHTGKPLQYLYNPWLQSVSVQVAYGFGNTHEISSIGISGYLYFPSPVPTHSIRLYAGIQNKVKGLFSFSDIVHTPRGFRFVNPNDLRSSFQINYSFPIVYPDWACGNLAYFKRIHANLFCDGMFLGKNCFRKSVGAEIYLNTNVLQISTPVTVGGRIAYLPDSRNVSFDFLFSIDI